MTQRQVPTLSHDDVRDLVPGFVLGALEPEEERAVREHLATCMEPHPDVDAFGGVVPYLNETVELIEPPASLKARVLAAAAAEPRPGTTTPAPTVADAATPAAAPTQRDVVAEPPTRSGPRQAQPSIVVPFPNEEERLVRERRRRSPLRWVAAVAAVVAIAGLGAWNVMLQRQVATLQPFDSAVAAVFDVAARPGSRTAILHADTTNGPRGIASVGPDGTVAFAVRDLTPTTGTEVYEAWAVSPNGQTPLGSFSVAADGSGRLVARTSPPTAGLTLGLTREPAPGATAPTLPMITSGAASAAPSS